MKTIYFVRHGETDGNIGGFWQGPNQPLNHKGKQQVESLASRAQNLPLDRVFVSTMARARETADIMFENTQFSLESNALFVENKDPSSVYSDGPDIADHALIEEFKQQRDLHKRDAQWRFEDEENIADFMQRIVKAKEFLSKQPESKIMVVSHGNFIRCLAGHVVTNGNYSLEEASEFKHRFKTTNTGVTVFLVDGPDWQLLTWNDHAHFAE